MNDTAPHNPTGCARNRLCCAAGGDHAGAYLALSLEFVDFDPVLDQIHFVYALEDHRLPEWRFIHVATDRCGWVERCHNTPVEGLCWDETDDIEEGLPLNDHELLVRLRSAIQSALAPVDLARLLLVHYPPEPFRRAA
jgi:hypothetical protein